MLYRTHHHNFLFTFNALSKSSLSPHSFHSSPSSRVQGMETTAFGDDFLVDELLDLSNGFEETEELHEPEEKKQQDMKKACCVAEENVTALDKQEFGSLPCSELNIPEEGLESLEWLSHFVEESFSDYPHNTTPCQSKPAVPVQEHGCFTTPVQTKARTKRARTGVRVWPVLSESSSSSSSSSTHSTTSFPQKNRWPVQKLKLGDGPRRCSHCGVTKTPQWRAGPNGSKTLCNACGVRYKSGRLLPEYRPACSPTFSLELHSNNHRKVLEMRRKKEPEMGTAGSVRTF